MSNSAFSNQPLLGTSGVTAGTYNQLTVNANGIVTAGTNITGDLPINQTAHGFSVGNLITFNGSVYAKALADNAADAEVVGIVASVIDANNFNLCVNGTVTGLSSLTAGSVYYLSPTTGGALTITPPTTLGQVSKPVLVATSGTSGLFFNWRGTKLGSTASIAASTLLGNSGTSANIPGAISIGNGLTFNGTTLNSASSIPQGRLTLSSVSPVVATTVSSGTVYYLPYIGTTVPIYNGTSMVPSIIPSGVGAAQVLSSSNNVLGGIYDIFALQNAGTVALGCGPAWSNATTRSLAVTQINGVYVSASTGTYTNGTASSVIPANQATYLGSIYCYAAGSVLMSISGGGNGGTNTILGLYNAYNRVRATISNYDSSGGTSQLYTLASSSSAWAAMNGSGNRIYWLDGEGNTIGKATNYANVQSAPSAGLLMSIGVNSSSGPSGPGIATIGFAGTSASSTNLLTVSSTTVLGGVFGFNYVQSIYLTSGSSIICTGGGYYSTLILDYEI